ncbi:NADH dehydrogenase [ubiquinone] 1 alpha subcomplex assembly factor 8 [Nothobranchius furzeri]|uniref:NADH:ubiquinone oxidoreductase complex assembly factor 8 n=2 Tax=Nothobranchius furzeri TaxID=105023 RepID=A0A9D2XME2_NOTFU|nr:NADH dehydrogenase [ubiquinone] 1 alpha subcomplex assembly factor 8 isoform X2 [Nothobranchius furzeri]KAF7204765.1 hypothetical protein G4P62_012305 [Nothobranchius furzeri]
MTNNIFHHSLIQQHKGLLCCCLMRNMSGSNNVWSRNRERLRLFSEVFAQCADEAAAYGKCVAATTTGRQELKKDLCAREFQALKTCFTHAAKKRTK